MSSTESALTRPWSRNARMGVAALVAAAGVILLLDEAHVRLVEARFAADVLSWTHIGHAHAVGSSVIFPHHQQWIGFSIAASCTAALLICPFFLIAAGLLLSGRIPVVKALVALGAVSAIVWLVNQFRLLIIGAAMQIWGFQTGYSRSHLLAGGVISTIGVGIGIAVYVGLLLHERPAQSQRGAS